jgi:ABC-type polar amino acid transport system ATPase subunit
MQNVDVQVKGNKMTVTVDLAKVLGPSKSGKTVLIATTEGNQKINGGDVYFGLNVYKKADTNGSK